MTEEQKKKPTNVEDAQEMVRIASNKGIGNVGICTTAANTAAKEVTLGSTFELTSGATMIVTFQNAVTVAGATLAVTHTPLGASAAVVEAAKPIYYRGAALPAGLVYAGDRLILRYEDTRYNVVGTLAQDISGKADKTGTVSDVTYDQTTGKLKKTIGGNTTNICDVVTSGFRLTHNNETGADEFEAIGTATFTHNNETGADSFAF